MAEDRGGSEIRPIIGNPYFHFMVTKSAMNAVVIPKAISDLLPFSAVEASVSCRGRWWRMTYQGNWYNKRIQEGWRKFVDDNSIRVGDACVFELLQRGSRGTRVKFAVQILRDDDGERASGSSGVHPKKDGEGRDPKDPIILE